MGCLLRTPEELEAWAGPLPFPVCRAFRGPHRRKVASEVASVLDFLHTLLPEWTVEEPGKRRRVSFGGRLRPELFDENLPPNTPLKRGETPKRRQSATPSVLKKIIKVGSPFPGFCSAARWGPAPYPEREAHPTLARSAGTTSSFPRARSCFFGCVGHASHCQFWAIFSICPTLQSPLHHRRSRAECRQHAWEDIETQIVHGARPAEPPPSDLLQEEKRGIRGQPDG